jgi:hypothetical protein
MSDNPFDSLPDIGSTSKSSNPFDSLPDIAAPKPVASAVSAAPKRAGMFSDGFDNLIGAEDRAVGGVTGYFKNHTPGEVAEDFKSNAQAMTPWRLTPNLLRHAAGSIGELATGAGNLLGKSGDYLGPVGAGSAPAMKTVGSALSGLSHIGGSEDDKSLAGRAIGDVGSAGPILTSTIFAPELDAPALAKYAPTFAKIPGLMPILERIVASSGKATALTAAQTVQSQADPGAHLPTLWGAAASLAENAVTFGLPGALPVKNVLARLASGAGIGVGINEGLGRLNGQAPDLASNIAMAMMGGSGAVGGAHETAKPGHNLLDGSGATDNASALHSQNGNDSSQSGNAPAADTIAPALDSIAAQSEQNRVVQEQQQRQAAATSRFSDGMEPPAPGEPQADYVKRVVDQMPAPEQRHLPNDPHAYFDVQPGDQMFPIDALQSTKEGRSGEHGIRRMAAAADGAIDKRPALTGRLKADGTVEILDGNGTLTAAKQSGLTDLPVKIVEAEKPPRWAKVSDEVWDGYVKAHPEAARAEIDKANSPAVDPSDPMVPLGNLPREASDILTAQYKQAAESKPAFDVAGQKLADSIPGAHVVLSDLKGRARAEEKMGNGMARDGDHYRLRDLLRMTIVVPDMESAAHAFAQLQAGGMGRVAGVRDHLTPGTEPMDDTGYRDGQLIVQLDNGSHAEVQIATQHMLDAKKSPGHQLYMVKRSMESRATQEGRRPTEHEQHVIDLANEQARAVYADAYKKSQNPDRVQKSASVIHGVGNENGTNILQPRDGDTIQVVHPSVTNAPSPLSEMNETPAGNLTRAGGPVNDLMNSNNTDLSVRGIGNSSKDSTSVPNSEHPVSQQATKIVGLNGKEIAPAEAAAREKRTSAVVDRIKKTFAIDGIHVVTDEAQIPRAAGFDGDKGASAFFGDDKQIYILAHRQENARQTVQDVVHELAHRGVRALLGEKYDSTMLAVYKFAKLNPESEAGKMLRGIESDYRKAETGRNEGDMRVVLGDEVMAHLSEKYKRIAGEQRGLVSSMLDAFRSRLRKIDPWHMSDDKIFHLMDRARKLTGADKRISVGDLKSPKIEMPAKAEAKPAPVKAASTVAVAEPKPAPKVEPVVEVAPEPAPSTTHTEHAIVELPLHKIVQSADVPQFKDGSNADGVVEPLGGKFDRRGTGPIQVWKRLDGTHEVISGRHRLDLARRSGETTIPAQVYNEADGFDKHDAGSLDAELNIRDGQGKVADYVQYFQTPAFQGKAGKAAAESRGLLARAIGQRAYAIATQGEAELIAAHRAGRLTDEAAFQIAGAAPSDARLQALGMKQVQEGRAINVAVNMMRAVKSMLGDRPQRNGDMFGFDDSAISEAVKMAGVAVKKQRDITERLAAIVGASKRPQLAAKEGVNVQKSAAVMDKRIRDLKAEKSEWDSWHTDPAKVAEIRAELGLADVVAQEPVTEEQPEHEVDPAQSGFRMKRRGEQSQSGELFAPPSAKEIQADAIKRADDERNGIGRDLVGMDHGGLFGGPRPEQGDMGGARKRIREETKTKYDERVDALFRGGEAKKGTVMADESDVMSILGYKKIPLVLGETHLREDGIYNHGLTASHWKKMPQWIENPIAVFNSQQGDGRLTMIGPELVNGHPVIIAIKPEVTSAGYDSNPTSHLLVTAFDKDKGVIPLHRWMAEGLLRYSNMKDGPKYWQRMVGRPLRLSDNASGRAKVLTEADLYKYRAENGLARDGAENGLQSGGTDFGSKAYSHTPASPAEARTPRRSDEAVVGLGDSTLQSSQTSLADRAGPGNARNRLRGADDQPEPETTKPSTPTGIRNEQVRNERAAAGLDEIQYNAGRDNRTIALEAAQAVKDNPDAGITLAESIAKKPRNTSDTENQILALDRKRIIDGRDTAEDDIADAIRSGNKDKKMAAERSLQIYEEELRVNDKAAKISGSHNSSALRSRQIMSDQQYDDSRIVNRVAALSGKDANPVEVAPILADAKRIRKLGRTIDRAQVEARGLRDKRVPQDVKKVAMDNFAKRLEMLKAIVAKDKLMIPGCAA